MLWPPFVKPGIFRPAAPGFSFSCRSPRSRIFRKQGRMCKGEGRGAALVLRDPSQIMTRNDLITRRAPVTHSSAVTVLSLGDYESKATACRFVSQ